MTQPALGGAQCCGEQRGAEPSFASRSAFLEEFAAKRRGLLGTSQENLRNARDRSATPKTRQRAPPAALVPPRQPCPFIPYGCQKRPVMTYGTKRSTTFGRGPAHSRESGLGVDQRPLACLSPSFSPHSPPSSSHSPFSCHGQKNSFLPGENMVSPGTLDQKQSLIPSLLSSSRLGNRHHGRPGRQKEDSTLSARRFDFPCSDTCLILTRFGP